MSPRAYSSRAELLRPSVWQMTLGERSALVGLLSALKPGLAIEIGTAEGGSLAQLAAHSDEVHSFDLVAPGADVRELPNVTFHTGDGHELLPRVLADLAAAGREVDFVLVDGDHSSEGVARDMADLLESDAVRRAVIVMHDTMNEVVRAGVESIDYAGWDKVRYVDLDFVGGRLFREPLLNELWGGLGLVIVDADGGPASESPLQQTFYATFDLLVAARDRTVEAAALQAQIADRERRLHVMETSKSWRVTRPLRRLAERRRRTG